MSDNRDLEINRKAEDLRNRFTDDVNQLSEIYSLYNEFVAAGVDFPPDIEEQSLRLILKFVRPDDNVAASRLSVVLRQQGKPVPDEVRDLSGRYTLRTHEFIARAVREAGASREAVNPAAPPGLDKRLFFVFGLPKSASRFLVSVLSAMHPDERFRKPAVLPYSTGLVGVDATSELRFEQLKDFADGGVAHSHIGPGYPTRFTLSRMALGHAITVRHPADHIAALYCHVRNIAIGISPNFVVRHFQTRGSIDTDLGGTTYSRYGSDRGENDLFFHQVIFPIDGRYILDRENIDAAIAHMLRDGYLFHALAWMVEWHLFRVRNISAVVKYEDFIGRPEETIRRLNEVIFSSSDEQGVARGMQVFEKRQNYKPSAKQESYPRGPAGSPGAWKAYLSKENQDLYNKVCRNFVNSHPYGKVILDIYEDLYI